MTDPTNTRTGAQLLVEGLAAQGVTNVFCVPGESYLAVLDALHDSDIAITICRQEGGVAMMADATARLTGRPGIAFVTRGPGATNASAGLHIAEHDSTPMILFVGQIARDMRGRGAFQELDYEAVFGSIAKWVVEIDNAARIPELLARAFQVALQGRPGPVVVSLPEDMLTDRVPAAATPRVEAVPTWPGLTQMAELQKLLWAAERPLVVAGGSGWTEAATTSLRRFAERFGLPVATSFRRAMLFDGDHACYAGEAGVGINPKLAARIKAADLVLLFGTRFAEAPSQGYTLLDVPAPHCPVVHVHADAAELGRVYHPRLGIHATPAAFAASLEALQPPTDIRWRAWTEAARADFVAWTDTRTGMPGPVQLTEIMLWLRDRLPHDAIVTNGAGNFAVWVGRFLRYRRFGTQLASTSGSMGYGVPAAVAAKRARPDTTVVCFAGDGDFLMTGQEFATAIQYDLPIIVCVVDNGMFGTIRMHQEREYPGRVSGTTLRNPDFAAYARAFGGHGETVLKTEDFAPAFERAIASKLPAIVHIKIDPDALSPTATVSGLRARAKSD